MNHARKLVLLVPVALLASPVGGASAVDPGPQDVCKPPAKISGIQIPAQDC